MLIEKRAGWGIHSFLAHFVLAVDPFPGLERIFLMGFDQDRTVHLLHLLFSIPVDLKLRTRHLFACQGELTNKRFPR